MRKSVLFYILFLTLFFTPSLKSHAEALQGGVSILENLPSDLYGSWIVSSIQTYTNNSDLKSLPGIDYWNIYRHADVLTLENPQTNARASVTVTSVKNNTVTFTRKAEKENEETTETPTITINGENFWGTDKMVMKKYKNGTLIRTDVVEFMIRGRKIGGESTQALLN